MLSCAIDAKEGRYVLVTDIPGAFLLADLEKCLILLVCVNVTLFVCSTLAKQNKWVLILLII